MRTVPAWIGKAYDTNKTEQCIYDVCFSPDGIQLIVAAGQIVSVYDCQNGSIIQTLKGHKDNVYCVNYCLDGSKFASGGADKTVIIWTSKLEPLLKYVHNDAVQCLAFNPVTNVLASCSSSDFVFWSIDQKAVQKHKIASRINACSWNSDGQYLALGLMNGNVSIRNMHGEEKTLIERENSSFSSPVWALEFCPERGDDEILCITDWSQKLMLYSMDGKEINKEQNIGFEALSVSYMAGGNYILVAGCNKQCVLMSRDGVRLGTVAEEQESWIWSCKAHPTSSFVVFGCQDGTIAYFQLVFSTVHDLYREKYSFRENMTDVIVQNLITDEKVYLKCRDWVKKIAIYKNRLAVLLPSRVVVYESSAKETDRLHYQIRAKLNKSFDCNLLVVCSEHLVFCFDTKLQCYTFDGKNVGQWIMDDVVRYIKVVGGCAGHEGLIIGLANGQILKIYINEPFSVPLVKSNSAVLCLALSMTKRKLAIVNEEKQCIVYDIVLDQIIYQESNAISVAWNALYEDMLCYSGDDGTLNIKIRAGEAHRMKFNGLVVGVYGAKVFSLNGSKMTTVDIPLSAPMYQCLEKQRYQNAYEVACLGVTENDWRALAHAAIEGFELKIAAKAFSRVKDLRYLDLIHELHENQDKFSKESFMGDLMAYEGKFKEASKYYQKAGASDKALAMYTDMRMFDLAQEYVKSENVGETKSLIRKKAEWAKNVNEPKTAVEMYLTAGDVAKAVEIAVENRWSDMLKEFGRKLERNERESLTKIADCLCELNEKESAVEVYSKIAAHDRVLRIRVDEKNWPAAFAIVDKYPQFESILYIPYARWLIENDKFVDAQKAFHRAGKPEEATKVLKMLIENAIDEGRFDDVGYYHWILSRQFLDTVKTATSREDELLNEFRKHDNYSEIYYAYHAIRKYLEEPFTSCQPETLFNIARYLWNETRNVRPPGVSQFSILYSLAKQAKNLGGFKIARQALERIQNLRVPEHFQYYVDMATIMMKAKPYHDNDELLILCYRCSSHNSLVISTSKPTGNFCAKCKQPFVFSFVTFEMLPLVEFELEEGISDAEAVKLLQTTPKPFERAANMDESQFQTLVVDDATQNALDLFTDALINVDPDDDKFSPVIVNRETLQSMDSSLVLICEWPEPLRYRYYRNLVPEWQIISCSVCFKIFHIDDFEREILQKGHCPFCRSICPERRPDSAHTQE